MNQEVRWNSDPAVRYAQCAELHPESVVRIRQIEPTEDDSVPSLPIGSYAEMVEHVRSHWNGQDAVYRWTIGDASQPQWAAGDLVFKASEQILQFFAYDHLPEHLQEVSRDFHELAHSIVDALPRNAERTVALRKLLEAKDAAVRARLAK